MNEETLDLLLEYIDARIAELSTNGDSYDSKRRERVQRELRKIAR